MHSKQTKKNIYVLVLTLHCINNEIVFLYQTHNFLYICRVVIAFLIWRSFLVFKPHGLIIFT